MSDLILAFDFGGTKLTAAVTWAEVQPDDLYWLAHRRVFSPAAGSAQFDLATMITLGRELLGAQKPAAIGVSFGGPVDHQAGMVRLSHHVPGWEDTPLRAIMKAAFGAPVSVDNDANAAALGEYHLGAGRGRASLMYVTVSTGVGGGWILAGQAWRGHGGMAGEIGHTVVDPRGPVCLCGKRGCVERLASGPYMAQDWAAERENSGGEVETITGMDVAAMALQGDEAARRIFLRGARAVGVGIGNAANLINPQLFVLGGGVTKSGALWWETVRRAARGTALPEVDFVLVPAALGDDSPLWGAVVLARQRLEGRNSMAEG